MSNRVPIVVHEVNVRHTVIFTHHHILHHETKCVVSVRAQTAHQCNPILFLRISQENTHEHPLIQMMTISWIRIRFPE